MTKAAAKAHPEAAQAEPAWTYDKDGSGKWEQAKPVAQMEVTEEMVTAYLTANDAYWKRADELPARNPAKWRQGTPSEATRVSLRAALDAMKAEPAEDAARLEQYRKALHYVAFALHGTPQHMLATGITLMDNDRVTVNVGGIAVDTGRVADPFAAFDAARAEAERKSAAAGER